MMIEYRRLGRAEAPLPVQVKGPPADQVKALHKTRSERQGWDPAVVQPLALPFCLIHLENEPVVHPPMPQLPVSVPVSRQPRRIPAAMAPQTPVPPVLRWRSQTSACPEPLQRTLALAICTMA